MERFFILLYPILFGYLVFHFIPSYSRSKKEVIPFLDSTFDLNFTLINKFNDLVNNPSRGSLFTLISQVPCSIKEYFTIFFHKCVRPFLQLFLLLSLLILFATLFPVQKKQYLRNVRSLFLNTHIEINDQIPKVFHKNAPFYYYFSGNLESVLLKFEGGGFVQEHIAVANQTNFYFSMSNDVRGRITGRLGRHTYSKNIFSKYVDSPKVQTIKITSHHPVSHEKKIVEGVFALRLVEGTKVDISLFVENHQDLKAVSLFPSCPLNFKTNHISFSFVLKNSVTFDLQMINQYELLSFETNFLSVMTVPNAPPQITLSEPKGGRTFLPSETLLFQVNAEDDISLKRVETIIFLKNGKNKSDTIKKTLFEAKGSDITLNFSYFDEIDDLRGKLNYGNSYGVYATAEDYAGLRVSTSTNFITFLRAKEVLDQVAGQLEDLETELENSYEQSKEILKEISKITQQKSQRGLKKDSVTAVNEKIEALKGQLEKSSEKIKSIEKEANLEKNGSQVQISPEILEKLSRIKKEIETIDKKLLDSLQSEIQEMLTDTQVSQEDFKNFLEKNDSSRLEKELDNILKNIEALRQLERLLKLEVLAKALYQKHEDLRAWAEAKNDYSFYDERKKEIEEDFDGLRDSYLENEKIFQKFEPSDLEAKEKIENIKKNLSLQSLESYKNFKASDSEQKQSSEKKGLSEQSKLFSELRSDFDFLAKRDQQLNLDLVLSEIQNQIDGGVSVAHSLENYEKEVKNNSNLKSNFPVELSFFLAENDVAVGIAERELYDILAGYLPGITSYFEIYKIVRDEYQRAKPFLDPAQADPDRGGSEYESAIANYNFNFKYYISTLIRLKQYLKQKAKEELQQSQMNQMGQMQQSLGKRMKQMGKSGSPSEAQKQYLKESAMEQALIRSMLESLGKASPSGKSGKPKGSGKSGDPKEGRGEGEKKEGAGGEEPGGGSGGESEGRGESGYEKQVKKLITEMKKMEELLRSDNVNIDKIIELQKRIEENLLSFDKGIKPNSEKEEDEREATSSRKEFFPITSEGKNNSSVADKLQQHNDFPNEFKTRMLFFLREKR